MNLRTAVPGEAHVETEMAALAARFINSTNRHVFLTGKAGTGKTTFLHRLAAGTHKRHVILAPTGIAALNAKGVTIHSQFLLPFGAFLPEKQRPLDIPEGAFHDQDTLTRRHPLNALRRNVLREVDLLIIDEVSMLRADVLDAIDFRMRAVRQNRRESFGGAQVLLIGDLYQLPPVVKDEEWRVMQRYYASMHFFESLVLKQHGYAHIELDRIFRQQDDRFIRILNNLRDNKVQAGDVAELNAHHRSTIPAAESEGVITLTTHNHKADELNQQALAKLPGKAHAFEAEIDGDFPQSMYPVLERIELKVGAQVMFVKNDPEKMYFNGRLARVEALSDEGITVRMYDEGPTGILPGGADAAQAGPAPRSATYKLKRETWENKRYVVNAATKEQEEEVLGTFEQYPIKLAWAITVHKSQGLTFSKAIIDVGQAFAPGQVYVALSRLRSLDGLILRTRIDPSVVSTDRDVVAFTQRGEQQEPLPQQLHAQQRAYLQQLLAGTFDLGDLLRKVEWTEKDHPETAQFESDDMKTALQVLRDTLRSEEENTRKFRGQLMRLLFEDRRAELLERIEKGGAYYGDLLQERMKALVRHIAQAELLSRTKEYTNALKEIDGMLMKRIATIAKVAMITRCILNGEEIQRPKDIEQGLAAKRAALVGEARAWAEEHRPKGRTGKRRKPRAAADPSGAVEAGEPVARPAKGATYASTYALVKEGLSVEQIAQKRQMARSTIEGHLARGIGEGVVELDGLMPETERDLIADWMRENPSKGLNEAAGHFDGRFGYGQLRMVQAWVKREA
ncbi:MAG TPA: AAA family ATPase [Flavobacteriales bacterium]|nr:AAA family ATPase [Flavobacteriales bacterium]HMR27843.1 AAA family ATPase [Flavobacteriales bacterium]